MEIFYQIWLLIEVRSLIMYYSCRQIFSQTLDYNLYIKMMIPSARIWDIWYTRNFHHAICPAPMNIWKQFIHTVHRSTWEKSGKEVAGFGFPQTRHMNVSSELVHLPRLAAGVLLANLAPFVNPTIFHILPIH